MEERSDPIKSLLRKLKILSIYPNIHFSDTEQEILDYYILLIKDTIPFTLENKTYYMNKFSHKWIFDISDREKDIKINISSEHTINYFWLKYNITNTNINIKHILVFLFKKHFLKDNSKKYYMCLLHSLNREVIEESFLYQGEWYA
jgi:hypothetical protein